jgi:hypothetical protein
MVFRSAAAIGPYQPSTKLRIHPEFAPERRKIAVVESNNMRCIKIHALDCVFDFYHIEIQGS